MLIPRRTRRSLPRHLSSPIVARKSAMIPALAAADGSPAVLPDCSVGSVDKVFSAWTVAANTFGRPSTASGHAKYPTHADNPVKDEHPEKPEEPMRFALMIEPRPGLRFGRPGRGSAQTSRGEWLRGALSVRPLHELSRGPPAGPTTDPCCPVADDAGLLRTVPSWSSRVPSWR